MDETLEKLLTIRLVEDRLQGYCLKGLAGDLHFSKGQEAISVGVMDALQPTDHIVTHHRTIAHEIAKGADLYPLLAEILGKKTGVNGGLAGEMHIHNPDIRHDFSFQIVGTALPVGVGIAYALKNVKKNDEIVVAFFGDAATSNGAFHEALNIAAIHQVPILFVCENNGLAGNIRSEHYQPYGVNIAKRAEAFGILSNTVDGNDVWKVNEYAKAAVRKVRSGQPVLLEMMTTRLCWHKQGQRDARPADEIERLAKRDPITQWMADQFISNQARIDLEAQINAKLDGIFKQIDSDPLPDKVC